MYTVGCHLDNGKHDHLRTALFEILETPTAKRDMRLPHSFSRPAYGIALHSVRLPSGTHRVRLPISAFISDSNSHLDVQSRHMICARVTGEVMQSDRLPDDLTPLLFSGIRCE
jgi:hypothetical protein